MSQTKFTNVTNGRETHHLLGILEMIPHAVTAHGFGGHEESVAGNDHSNAIAAQRVVTLLLLDEKNVGRCLPRQNQKVLWRNRQEDSFAHCMGPR